MAVSENKISEIAKEMSAFLKVLGISEIPKALVKQVARRIGVKDSSVSDVSLSDALGGVGLSTRETYPRPDNIVFDIEANGGDIKPKDSDFFNGNSFQLSDVCQDLFSLGEFLQSTGVGVNTKVIDLRSPVGFQTLHEIFRTFVAQCDVGDYNVDDKVTRYFLNICRAARKQILGQQPSVNADNVKKYQHSFAIQKALKPFSRINTRELRNVIEFLEVPFIAEKAIAIIQKGGFNHGESVAIYNHKFGCAYEPTSGFVSICPKCSKVCNFPSEHEAISGKCNCGEPLFRICKNPNCRISVPSTTDMCPLCGIRESDIIKSHAYLKTADLAVTSGNLEHAEDYLFAAQAANPYIAKELVIVREKIDKVKHRRTELLSEIDTLISQKRFFAAADKLTSIKKECVVNAAIEQRIYEAQQIADTAYKSAHNEDDYRRILTICSDHPCAIEIPPAAPKAISATCYYDNNRIQISWQRSRDADVCYVLIRNKSRIPKTHTDGEVVTKTDGLFYEDIPKIPGVIHYTLFVERKQGGVVSLSGASSTVIFTPEVTKFALKQFLERVELTYDIPNGATSVKVLKTEGNKSAVLYEGNNSIVVDKDIATCSYTITACYGNHESAGQTVKFTRVEIPKQIKVEVKTKGTTIHLSWQSQQTGFLVKILNAKSSSFRPDINNIYSESELNSKTEEVSSSFCEQNAASFMLAPNQDFSLLVFIGGVNGYQYCETFVVSTNEYPHFMCMAKRVEPRGDHIFIFDKPLPPKVCKFNFAVQKDNTSEPAVLRPCSTDSTGKIIPEIKVGNNDYFGRYYVFYNFELNNGKTSTVFCDEVHFRQQATGQVRFKLKHNTLYIQIRYNLNRYDAKSYPQIPKLKLVLEGNVFMLEEVEIPRGNSSFTWKTEFENSGIQNLSAHPTYDLTPISPIFLGDFIFT